MKAEVEAFQQVLDQYNVTMNEIEKLWLTHCAANKVFHESSSVRLWSKWIAGIGMESLRFLPQTKSVIQENKPIVDWNFPDNLFMSPRFEWPFIYRGRIFCSVHQAHLWESTTSKKARGLILKSLSHQEADHIIANFLGKEKSDWKLLRKSAMRDILAARFSDPMMMRRLIATGNQPIIPHNNYGDLYWGVDLITHKGKNVYGKLLMKQRKVCQRDKRLLNNVANTTIPNMKV